MFVQKEKCEVLTGLEAVDGLEQQIEAHGFRKQEGALPLLGTVVGTDRKRMLQLVEEKVGQWKKTLALLAYEQIPTQLALLVGRWMMTAKPERVGTFSSSYPHQKVR